MKLGVRTRVVGCWLSQTVDYFVNFLEGLFSAARCCRLAYAHTPS